MSEEKKSVRWQWVSLVVVVCLLFVCILLLVGRSVRAAPLEAVPSVELAAPEEVIVAAVAAPGQESSAAALPPELAQLIDRDAEPQAMQADVDVAASTWWIGNYARPGGVAVYGVWYGNLEESTLRADGVILTSTLPAGTTYAGDTSGLPPDVGANGVITWTIGTLESGESAIFALTVNVLEDHPTGEGTLGERCVHIQTTTPGDPDPGNNGNCAGPNSVFEDDVELEVSKWPEPGDPAPGEEFDYVINWCNQRGAAAGPVVLTDTLPAGAGLVGWDFSPGWMRVWNHVSASDDRLVLEAPGLPGDWCANVVVRVALDGEVPPGTTLENLVEMPVAGDVNADNNWQLNTDAQVGPPRRDLWVDKSFNGGILSPGGWIGYNVQVVNAGNVPSPAWLTDTLPVEGTYIPGSSQLDGEDFPPSSYTDDEIFWDLGTMPVNQVHDLTYKVQIVGASMGALQHNCAVVAPLFDDSPSNNGACLDVQTFDHGPNLHVDKAGQWLGEQIGYQIYVANFGEDHISNVQITDTYPVGTTSFPWDFEPSLPDHVVITATSNYTDNQWLFEIRDFPPGEQAWIAFNVALDDPNLRPAFYTNTVEIELPAGDVNSDDNHHDDLIVLPEVEQVEIWLEPDGHSNMWGQAQPGVPVTVTTPQTQVVTFAGIDDCPSCWSIGDTDLLYPGDEIIVEAGDGLLPVSIITPDPFTAEVDRALGTVSGQIGGWLESPAEVRGWWDGGWQVVGTDGAGFYEAVYDWIPPGAEGAVYFGTESNYTQVGWYRHFRAMDLVVNVNYDHEWVEGNYEPGHTVWITVTESDGETVKATAEMHTQEIPWWGGGTGFTSNLGEPWVPEPPNLEPGDSIHGEVDNGYTATLRIGEISGVIDTDNDSIEGSVLAPWLDVPEVRVDCNPWGGPPEAPSKQSTADPTDGEPGYFCQWDPETEWDIRNGQQIGVSYYEPAGHQVYAAFEGPWTRVDYADDWVGVNYPVGHTFVVTVTDHNTGYVKGLAQFETTAWGGWGGPGHETGDDEWISLKPDIQTFDWVHFASDDGYRHSVQVGTIAASVSAPSDIASGYLDVDWWDGVVPELPVECQPWGGPQDAPSKESGAPPDASAPFVCEWDPVQEWDVLPGQNVAVMYIEPDDGDRIINVVHEPAPDLRVEKWVEGSGEVHSDGLSVWGIRIQNRGDAPAPTVVLTDRLPTDTSYFRDSSGVIPDETGDDVVWTFDTEPLPPGGQIQFHLVLRDSLPGPDVGLHNEVWAWTQYDSNPDDNNAGAEAWATDVEPGMLHIGKDPSSGDPAAGSTFAYHINYGNHEPGATGPVVLTDTIPGGTSIVGWYSQNSYGLWHDESTAAQLILAAPTLPGYWDDTIVLRLRVDPGLEVGTQLTNTAEIDWPGGHESALRDDVWVGEPYWDTAIHKEFAGGALVPGGLIDYSTHIQNQGNMTATIRLTDTLYPIVAHPVESWCQAGQQSFECPFTTLPGGVITMDLGEIPPGGYVDIGVRWQLDYDPEGIGQEFGNCVMVAAAEGDSSPYNNTACSEPQTIREWGPNLRVRKGHSWDQEGNALHYDVSVENLGSQALDNLLITDIYPEGTTFNEDNWGVQHGPWITITHNAPSRELVFWVDRLDPGNTAGIWFNVDLTDPSLRPAWYTNALEAPVDGDVWPEDNYWQDLAVKTEVQRVELWVSPAPQPSSMWGDAAAGPVVTVTTPYSTVTAYVGQPDCDTCWRFESVGPLMPGDVVTVKAGAGLLPVEVQVPAPFEASVDTDAGQVSGQIDHLDTHLIEIHGDWDGGYQEVQTDSDGNFLAQYDNIPRGVNGYVRFVDEANYAEVIWHRPFHAMDLILEVNYGHDWVQGYYEPGHTVWITVTESDGVTPKGTAELVSQEVPEWGGFVGFSTDLGDAWGGKAPDMQPGDWVYGRVDNGYASEVQVGDITGAINVTAETIAGTVTAPWPGATLSGWCAVWVQDGPSKNFPVDAGGGEYLCDFSGEWDIQPGQDVAVGYYEPDQDQVMNVFREPAPDLNVSKWVEGNGQVQYNGLTVFHIRLHNEGDADAIPVILTDTLPAGMSYEANSSGIEPTPGAGNTLVWTFDSLGWAEGMDLWLVAANDLDDGEWYVNKVDVWTEFDTEPEDNHAEAEVQAVDTPGVDLGIGKSPQPNDPAHGETYIYEIDYGNNGPAATGPVTLVDTLPEGTSIDGWYSQNGYDLWTDASTAEQLILQAPALPGKWGDRIVLRLLVDQGVELGTQLINTVAIESPDGSASSMRDDVWVGEPRWEGFVDKRLAWGTLVPDGTIVYNVQVRNQGNMTAGFTLTDTLPVGTSFWQVWRGDHLGWVEIEPAYVDDEILVVTVGELKPAEFLDFEVRLHINPDLLPGSELENCVEINAVGPGDWPDDNRSCATDTVRGEGPNVRLQKDYQWNGESQLQYNLTFWNLGTETLYDVEIVDTLPDGTHWIDQWWNNFWEGIEAQVTGNQVTFTVSWLDPTWGSNIGFSVDLDEPWTEGTAYTNSALMPLEGDVFPDDNYDQVTAYTGPDLYAKKELTGGEPRPGALLTYTIAFGNDNQGPWNSDWMGEEQPSTMIVDLLPEGMTFITATAPWDPEEGWMPAIDGQELTWGFGPMNAGQHWKYQLVALVSESAEFGDVLTNTVEVLSLSPNDIDPLPDNNSSQVVLDLLAPSMTIDKEVSTSAVAGTVADYTLAVENVGNTPATGVSFAETLPDDLTYVDSDGVWDGTNITWSAGELAPFGGTADGWFSAKLTCEAGVLVANDTYSVTSDEGATATGATVEVTTIAPTIELSLASAPDPSIVGETVTLTVTAITDGTDLSFEWNFGDGPVSGGLIETQIWDTAGSYTVVVTATDECSFTSAVTRTVTIEEGTFHIYLPMVLKQHSAR